MMWNILFNRYEKGALLLLCLLLIALIWYYSYWMEKQWAERDKPAIEWIADSIPEVAELVQVDKISDKMNENRSRPRQSFPFDPNLISGDSLSLLGLPGNVIRNWLKYRENGGKFRDKQSVLKIYGMNEKYYSLIEPDMNFLTIHKKVNAARKVIPDSVPSEPKVPNDPIQIEINGASKEDWKKMVGIGDILSERIIQYKMALGGFYSISQIREVYGLPEDTYLKMENQLVLENVLLKKLYLNQVSFKELLRHPYTDYEMTRQLMNYRDQHKGIRDADDLKNIYLLDSAKVERLIPYLDFSERKVAGETDNNK